MYVQVTFAAVRESDLNVSKIGFEKFSQKFGKQFQSCVRRQCEMIWLAWKIAQFQPNRQTLQKLSKMVGIAIDSFCL